MNTKNTIVEQLKKELSRFKSETTQVTVGEVSEVFDGITRVSGLRDIKAGEMVTFAHGETGVALNLEEDTIGVVVLGDSSKIKEGDKVEFELQNGKKGMNAVNVTVIG